MRKINRKTPIVLLLLAMFVSACGNGNNSADSASSPSGNAAPYESSSQPPSPSAKSPVTLDFSTNASGGTLDAFKDIAERFNEEHEGITVEVAELGKDFNTLMTAKMASNDMPDLFSTAGWSVRRFGEYLLPLNDRAWASQVAEEIKPVVTDAGGNLLALPMDIDISGMVYNPSILQELGLSVPETWEQFLAACEAIKKAGYTPVAVAGKESSDIAGLMSRVSLSLLVQSNPDYKAAFEQGSFDWNQFAAVTDFVSNLKSKGYLNADYLTADKATIYSEFAKNKAAFAFQSNQTIAEIMKLNPDSRVSMMRIPVNGESSEPFLISGERDSVGVWKDTKHKEEALLFLDYLAQPDNVRKIAEAYSLPAGLSGVEANLGALQETFNQYEGAAVSNHFDRQYLPNGMFTTLGTVGSGLLSGTMDAGQVFSAMSEDYTRLTNAK
ncbi:ABC transporter substrate-binding protein [Cohnella thailandensis]|uniref:Extracellular solute-binding protein n=1 Tax=Cohnella thailandensis TaxID=557557 RepID=A0A841STE6_9BACL|nr:extracellular solute-binding protein [Cohnella thailandensis]MBB6633180.1 extracellular solute-binding protein [Cohnella thailandensis]MBP1975123.1 raffinose/stachyose/melibiose transport system substrate-binding protein [Cohnella thailandensis]